MEMVGLEWKEWQSHPMTKQFVKLLEQGVRDVQEEWLGAAYTHDDTHKSVELNAAALASARAMAKIAFAINSIEVEVEKPKQQEEQQ